MKTGEVFGVSPKQVASYVYREHVDSAFRDALAGHKHIVVYGSSKQGKSSLLRRNLPAKDQITIHCSPTNSLESIHRSILRKAGVQVATSRTESAGSKESAKVEIKAQLPLAVGGEFGFSSECERGVSEASEPVQIDLGNPDDIFDSLEERGWARRFVVLENFHYLGDDAQKAVSFALRTYEELGLRFIILGVWMEKNRLTQFNGDLQDRVAEIPVEPWDENSFKSLIRLGCNVLNIEFSSEIVGSILESAYGSVAVVQELCKTFCEVSEVRETQSKLARLDLELSLGEAKRRKAVHYSARQVKALRAMATSMRDDNRADRRKLNLRYHLVKMLLHLDPDTCLTGISKTDIYDHINADHPLDIRASDVTTLLNRLKLTQIQLEISPPLFDYDANEKLLRIIDSTFFYFMKHCDRATCFRDIPNPHTSTDGLL